MKILITGSRKTTNVDYIFSVLDRYVDKTQDTIITGGANGVDSIALSWCKINKVNSRVLRPIFPSKKEYYLYRNAEMVGMCDKCISFWDGKSRGTKFTFQYAKKRYKDTKIFRL